MTYPLVVLRTRSRLPLEAFADAAGLHPELVGRLVSLGLVEASPDQDGRLFFAPAQLAVLARVRRLHELLPLNYAAVGLVLDLLDRINRLERDRATSRGSANSQPAFRRVPWT